MTPLLAPAFSAASMAVLQPQCTVRWRIFGARPPSPWHPGPWHRWLPWWWFR